MLYLLASTPSVAHFSISLKWPRNISLENITLEMQHNGYDMHNPVTAIIVDDVLATGGTMLATNKLAYQAGYDVINHLVLVDLKFVPKIAGVGIRDLRVESVVEYE